MQITKNQDGEKLTVKVEGRDVKDRASFVKKMNELLVIALKK